MSAQAAVTVHREFAWLVVDAGFARLAEAPAGFFAPEVERHVQEASRTFYDDGLHVADQALAFRLAPVSAAEDPVTVVEDIVSALEALVRMGEGAGVSDRARRVRAFLVVAAETQRTVGFLPRRARHGHSLASR
jgi:hypothetical protein